MLHRPAFKYVHKQISHWQIFLHSPIASDIENGEPFLSLLLVEVEAAEMPFEVLLCQSAGSVALCEHFEVAPDPHQDLRQLELHSR